ncbi:orotate phosphoribosyltransferase [Metabacillus sp. GX 13764]|uniref:orotate phosphoribosyltransferase n=1 Tax=Metabacillus kandeliae TaxID=2900151 RepID=UPI001E2AB7D5|nr:orotate phosphoribosyltransferase [Metabacillus kandeliae]MCD7033857.1 orotate phosphoribosyltransferase [Metabacillus kandeliae]
MKNKIALHLLNIEAVALKPDQPYTWSSGMLSPIYCDNRLTLSYPEIRDEIAEEMAKKIQEEFPEADLIAGTATAGIPHAAWVSGKLSLPMCYVRGKAKEHGKGNQIEGIANKGQKAVIIEDLISTGGSVIKAAEALRGQGVEVIGTAAIFSYGFLKAEKNLLEAGLNWFSLTDYPALIALASEKGIVSKSDLEKLKAWRENPDSDAWRSA